MGPMAKYPWQPESPDEVQRLFSALSTPWWLAGGHAIDLAVGCTLRNHGDTDVMMLRRDHMSVQLALHGWEWWSIGADRLRRRWRPGQRLPGDVHTVWCRHAGERPWRIQVLLEEASGADW